MAATQGVHGLQSADDAFAVTADDNNDISVESRAIIVGAAGLVKVTMKSGTAVTIFCAAGIPIPVRATRIWSTGTDSAVKTAGITVLV